MTIKHGVAYGNMHGYPATLSEGVGFKIVAFTSVFESDEDGLHVLRIDYCHHCDKPIMGASSWKLVENVAFQFHPECVEAAIEEMKKEFAEDDEDDEDDDIDYGNHEIIIKDLD